MDKLKKEFASKLLKVKAIKLQPNDPFTWASGWKSPFYCDNRKTLSFPELRNYVKLELVHAILEQFPEADAVAGVATGAIAQGALVADELHLPFVYVRSKPKDHGMQNLIEGELDPKAKVVVVEDLISTGGSSLKAVEALRKNGNEIVGMVASYTYGFPVAEKAFADANVKLVTLTDYEHVVEEALETGYIKQEDVELLHEWRKDMSEAEIRSRYEITLDNYRKIVNIEAETMVDMARRQILPAVEKFSSKLAQDIAVKKSIAPVVSGIYETTLVTRLSDLVEDIDAAVEDLAAALATFHKIDDVTESANMVRDVLLPKMAALRAPCDEAEQRTAEGCWPFPTYGDLLFGVE